MKSLFLCACCLLAFSAVQAQPFEEIRSDTRGFFLNGHLNASLWTLNELDVDTEGGGGLGLLLGYGVTPTVAFYLTFDGAIIQPENRGNYTLAHLDLGLQLNLGPMRNPFRPYLDIGFTGRVAQFDVGPLAIEALGGGVSLGGGFRYFFNPPVAMDVGVKGTFGKIDEIQTGGFSERVDIDATSVRLAIGLTWFPGR